MNRNPPKEVREILRKEVNFGCPIEGCGSPYLEYHHFDPHWSEEEHHNPEGMIALCKQHHPVADGDAWTKGQLREIKSSPFIKGELIGRFDWLRRDILVMAAGTIIQNPYVILQLGNEKAIWLQKDTDGYYRLNMLIRDSNGRIVLEISDNDWIAFNERAIDIVCPPSGRELSIVSKDLKTKIAISFDDMPLVDFKVRLSYIWNVRDKARKKEKRKHATRLSVLLTQRGTPIGEKKKIIERYLAVDESQTPSQDKTKYINEIVGSVGNPERVTVCTLKASLEYQGKTFETKEGSFNCSSNIISIGLMRMSGSGTVFHFG